MVYAFSADPKKIETFNNSLFINSGDTSLGLLNQAHVSPNSDFLISGRRI
jgi:hypothetical protein